MALCSLAPQKVVGERLGRGLAGARLRASSAFPTRGPGASLHLCCHGDQPCLGQKHQWEALLLRVVDECGSGRPSHPACFPQIGRPRWGRRGPGAEPGILMAAHLDPALTEPGGKGRKVRRVSGMDVARPGGRRCRALARLGNQPGCLGLGWVGAAGLRRAGC